MAVIFVVAIVLFAVAGAAYWQNWNRWIFGGTLGARPLRSRASASPPGASTSCRRAPSSKSATSLASTPEERDLMAAALVERSAVVVKRRKLLGGLFAVGSGIFGIVAVFPLIRSLGPVPGLARDHRLAQGHRSWSTPTAGPCTRTPWWSAAS